MPALTQNAETPYQLLTANLGDAIDSALCIHTTRASLKLDNDGICREVFTLDGSKPRDIERIVGTHYLASLADADGTDLTSVPSVGAHALFVELGNGRPALIKTEQITGVVFDGDVVESN